MAEEFVQVVTVNDVVWVIQFKLSGHVSVGEVVRHNVAPEYTFAHIGCSDRDWLEIGLVNISHGIHIGLFEDAFREDEQATIAAHSSVYLVTYFEPTRFEDLAEAQQLYDALVEPETFLANLAPWNGYGEVSPINGCP